MSAKPPTYVAIEAPPRTLQMPKLSDVIKIRTGRYLWAGYVKPCIEGYIEGYGEFMGKSFTFIEGVEMLMGDDVLGKAMMEREDDVEGVVGGILQDSTMFRLADTFSGDTEGDIDESQITWFTENVVRTEEPELYELARNNPGKWFNMIRNVIKLIYGGDRFQEEEE